MKRSGLRPDYSAGILILRPHFCLANGGLSSGRICEPNGFVQQRDDKGPAQAAGNDDLLTLR